ncbi:unnamed protein product [Spirodela intermedia]|uniref:Trehalose-phosphatase n=1 Tax=Spirodela intermedia TaxID=51605 RepID=A0ABN7EB67_SPIIN|nr:unnamed protein product [Spirodela intermedia]
MTKQSAVVPEVVAPEAVVVTSQGLPCPLRPRIPIPASEGCRGFAHQEVPTEARNQQRREISSWVDSMKASSPTHIQGPPPPAQDEHPSALGMFEEIVSLSKGKKIVMFLDYDGTLSPIVDDPDRAYMSKAMRAAVRDVAKLFPTAIVSGRCRDKVYSFVRLAELYYAGSHGMDIKCPNLIKYEPLFETLPIFLGNKPVLFQPASEKMGLRWVLSFPIVSSSGVKVAGGEDEGHPGSRVENNRFCVSVHFRCVDEKRWVELAMQVRSVLHDFPKLRLTHVGQGKALEFLLESLVRLSDSNDVLPVYIGDDRTDEDAFKVLRERGQGFGILVSKVPKESHATYSLQEPSEVMDFLHRLVEWKRLSGKGHPRV